MMENIQELNAINTEVDTLREISLDIENTFGLFEESALSYFKTLADLVSEYTKRMNKLYKRVENILGENKRDEKAELNAIKAEVDTLREISLGIENTFGLFQESVLSYFKILADLVSEYTKRMNKLYKRVEKILGENKRDEKAELNAIKDEVDTLREISLDIENTFGLFEESVLSSFKILADLVSENTKSMNKLYKNVKKIEGKNKRDEKAECSGIKKPEIPTIILEEIKKRSSIRKIRVEAAKRAVSLKNVEIQDKYVPTHTMEKEQNADKVVDQREEEKVIIQTKIVVHVDELEKWIKHYSSRHRILLVGDGDFSFSAALARAFGCASNMISTSLDSKEFLEEHYRNARANIEELRNRSCKVMHGIDATKMTNHELRGHLTFDRIIYNFPYAGLITLKELPRESQLKHHRKLVSQFLKNAKEMISENGEIHISHKTNGFHREWNLEMVASSHRLRLIEAVDFNHLDYPGYNTKYGFGGDKNFDCYPSKTYKFGHKTGVLY